MRGPFQAGNGFWSSGLTTAMMATKAPSEMQQLAISGYHEDNPPDRHDTSCPTCQDPAAIERATLVTERDRALADLSVLRRNVEALHLQGTDTCLHCGWDWPCATRRALSEEQP